MVSGLSLSCRALLLGRLVALAASNAGVANTSSDLVGGAEVVELNSTKAEALDSDASGQEEASAFHSTGSETSALNSTEAEASASHSTGAETSALNSTEAEALALNSSKAEVLASSEPSTTPDESVGDVYSTTTDEVETGAEGSGGASTRQWGWRQVDDEASTRALNSSEAAVGQGARGAPASGEASTTADQGVGELRSTTEEAAGGTAEAPASSAWWAFFVDQGHPAWRWALAAAALCAALAAGALLWAARSRGRATRAAELQRLSSLDLEEGHPGGDAHFSDGMKYALVAAAEPAATEPLGARAAPLPVLLAPAAGPPQGFFKRAAAPAAAPAGAYVPLAWSGKTAVPSPRWVGAPPTPPLTPQQPPPTVGLPAAAAPGARSSARAQPAWQFGMEPVVAQGPFA